MCLAALKGSRKIAQEDIHVYKIIKTTDNPDTWDGPYYQAGLPFDQVVEVDSPDEESLEPFFLNYIECGGGFLHSHLKPENAKLELEMLESTCDDDSKYFITRAVIPKGSIYYTNELATDEFGHHSCAASNKLIVYKP